MQPSWAKSNLTSLKFHNFSILVCKPLTYSSLMWTSANWESTKEKSTCWLSSIAKMKRRSQSLFPMAWYQGWLKASKKCPKAIPTQQSLWKILSSRLKRKSRKPSVLKEKSKAIPFSTTARISSLDSDQSWLCPEKPKTAAMCNFHVILRVYKSYEALAEDFK